MEKKLSHKTFVEELNHIRKDDNLRSMKTISTLTGLFALAFTAIFGIRKITGAGSEFFIFYFTSFLILALLSFLMRFLYFLLSKKENKTSLDHIVYFYLLAAYFILIGISAFDSVDSGDFLAYTLAILAFSFLYRLSRIRLIITHSAGLLYFITLYYMMNGKIVSFVTLLPILAFSVFSFYISRSRELTQEKILKMADELEMTYREMKEISLRDPLTGLYNRRYCDDFLSFQFEIFQRKGTPFSVLLFDLDHFKTVNDTFGHSAGDDVLVSVAEMTLASIRKTDLAVRYGGEEFLLILSDTHLSSAEIIAERLRSAIEVVTFKSISEHVTISLGAGEIRKDEDTKSLVDRVDKALYEAKRMGRNQTVISP
ncbi:GGDEF domain-containing protein [Spirochaeta isovalerica]|uniref:diguanylate cyclase n=1 Tax=Spirochaeta isovalerica TaxID=150 RepID=A0A841RG28_9SPIO|nr:GGDEF domain-containing protein [Spirochaeta isovalerica]MBB6481739.1 diguanylate cyclase (GGDEF)-like protein [Spirochaeta isovalerica]